MHIPIPIPIGTKYVASIKGAVWKFVSCAQCQQGYAYLLELEATAEVEDLLFLDGEGAKQRAQAAAEENLWHKSRNIVLPVPCPTCGWYQEEMQRNMQDGASINRLQIAGAVIAALSLVPLAFSIPYAWVLTFVLAVVGVALLAYGYVVAFCFDPNAADQEERKALGRKHAAWGEQLAELLATRPYIETNAAAEGGRDPDTERKRMAYITAHADGKLDFDRLIDCVSRVYPGTKVTDPDYYATRIARELEISKELGMPIPNPPLESTQRVAKEHGLQRAVELPIRAGLCLYGRLGRLGGYFSATRDATETPTLEEVQPLIDVLNQFGLRVETGGIENA